MAPCTEAKERARGSNSQEDRVKKAASVVPWVITIGGVGSARQGEIIPRTSISRPEVSTYLCRARTAGSQAVMARVTAALTPAGPVL